MDIQYDLVVFLSILFELDQLMLDVCEENARCCYLDFHDLTVEVYEMCCVSWTPYFAITMIKYSKYQTFVEDISYSFTSK